MLPNLTILIRYLALCLIHQLLFELKGPFPLAAVVSQKNADNPHNLWIQRDLHIWQEFTERITATFHQNGSTVRDYARWCQNSWFDF